MALEMECGQNVDHIFEKRFSGDFRLGLKIIGNILQVYCWWKFAFGSIIIFLMFPPYLRVTAQCIQTPYTYLAKRLTNTKVMWMHHPYNYQKVIFPLENYNLKVVWGFSPPEPSIMEVSRRSNLFFLSVIIFVFSIFSLHI